jgi:Concanavalin A-like lectin/glucanases superfamily
VIKTKATERAVALLLGLTVLGAWATPAWAQTSSTTTKTVALWHMNELSGSTMFDSGVSPANNGTISNVTLGVAGINGTTGYGFLKGSVTVPNNSSLNPGTLNLTVAVSANPSTLPLTGDFDVIRKGDSPAQQYKMEILPSGALFCGFRGSIKSATVTSTKLLAPNTGYHTLQCIKTTYQIKAIVDGSATALNAKVGSISNSAPVVIGAHGGGTFNDYYKGSLDEASISTG